MPAQTWHPVRLSTSPHPAPPPPPCPGVAAAHDNLAVMPIVVDAVDSEQDKDPRDPGRLRYVIEKKLGV